MDVLLIGEGGREHALAWKIRQSKEVRKLYIAPGNSGTGEIGENVNIAATDVEQLVAFAQKHKIDLTIVGPENPLDLGIVDAFRAAGLRIFGPSKAAAQIESSKAFAKDLMQRAGVPTAEFRSFEERESAIRYVRERGAPIVVKNSGLVFGKGVHICESVADAEAALEEIFSSHGEKVVIEDFLIGPEVSIHALCAGEDFILFPASQDHKHIGEDNTGKMTGGIGAIHPLPFMTAELVQQIGDTIVRPILSAMAKDGMPFSGLLYPGLILTNTGPKVLEFNSRFGDPECALYMRLLDSDIIPLLEATIDGTLSEQTPQWSQNGCVNLVLCSGGYPGSYEKGLPISGVKDANAVPGVVVFHAGTTTRKGTLVTNGGRVFGITGVADNLKEALDRAYEAAEKIQFKGKYYRRDIGAKSL